MANALVILGKLPRDEGGRRRGGGGSRGDGGRTADGGRTLLPSEGIGAPYMSPLKGM